MSACGKLGGPPKQWGQLGVKKLGLFFVWRCKLPVGAAPASGLTGRLHRVCTSLPSHMLPFHCHQGQKSCTTPFLLSPEKNLHFHQKVFTAHCSIPPSCSTSYIHPTTMKKAQLKRESGWVMLNWSISAPAMSYPDREGECYVPGANTKANTNANTKVNTITKKTSQECETALTSHFW